MRMITYRLRILDCMAGQFGPGSPIIGIYFYHKSLPMPLAKNHTLISESQTHKEPSLAGDHSRPAMSNVSTANSCIRMKGAFVFQ